MRCLFVTKEYAREPTSGGTLRTAALARALEQRFDLTVVAPSGAVSGSVSPRAFARYRSISGLRTAGPRFPGEVRRALRETYDLAVVDHMAIAALAGVVSARCDRVIVSMHNVESALMADRASGAARLGARPAMAAEARLLRRLEKRVAERFPVIVCTAADAAYVSSLGGSPVLCPNGVDPVVLGSAPRRARSVVFTGALDWEPNVQGLAWFVEKVWPRVRSRVPEATLTVAGRRPGRTVIGICSAPGVVLIADPARMAPVLERHMIGVVPVLTGGGSRIKILEYLAAGLDVVSTSLGAAGLSVPPALLTSVDAAEVAFARVLTKRLLKPREVTAGPEWVAEHHAWPVTLAPLLSWIDREVVKCVASPGPSPIRVSRA